MTRVSPSALLSQLPTAFTLDVSLGFCCPIKQPPGSVVAVLMAEHGGLGQCGEILDFALLGAGADPSITAGVGASSHLSLSAEVHLWHH